MEKKQIKISLGMLIAGIIILILIAVIVGMGLYFFNQGQAVETQISNREIGEKIQNNNVLSNDNQITEIMQTSQDEGVKQQNTNQNNYMVLIDGYEIGKKYGRYDISDGMKITNETLKRYNTKYYNYEDGKYLGESKGVFGTDETTTVENWSVVGNVKKVATTLKYDAMPRTYTKINTLPNELKDMADYTSVNIHSIDLDGDNKNEYIVCTTLEYAEGEIGDGKPEASSDIMLFDSNYSKVAELVSIPDGFWDSIRKTDDNKRLLKLDDVTYADIDNDGIMEIIIETPVWEGRAVNVYKYKNGEIYGPTDYQINLQP